MINFLRSNLVRIMTGIIISLMLLCGGLAIYSVSQQGTIAEYKRDNDILSRDNNMLQSRIQLMLDATAAAEKAAAERATKDIDTNVRTEEILSAIDKLGEAANENKTTSNTWNNTLDPELVRLLNQQCQAVRGRACADP